MARPEIESSVQMRLYTLTKRQFIVVFLIFVVAFAFFLFIGILGPAVMLEIPLNATCRIKDASLARCSSFSLSTLNSTLTAYNQQLWVVTSLRVDRKSSEELENRQMLNISVHLDRFQSKGGLLSASSKSWCGEELGFKKQRVMICHGDGSCDDIVVLHLGYLSAPAYRFCLQFHGSFFKSKSKEISKIDFVLKTYNPAFTELEIWMRVIFLFLSFLSGCWFVQVMKKFAFRDWCLEQRFMALLLPLVLLYNNPLFPLNFLTSSWLPGTVDGFFQVTFLCSLLLFWICLYHGIRVNERRFVPFYLPKFIIVGLLWLTAFTLSTWQVSNALHDPTYSVAVDASNFLGFKTFFFIVGSVYVLYLLYLVVRAFAELRSLPFFDLRLRFLTLLVIFVLAVSIAVFVLRLGSSVSQDNLVAELSFTYKNSAEFLTFYSLLNLYVYLMSYVYSPSKNAVYETYFRDNPTMSMLNETDDDGDDDDEDDVIYDEADVKRRSTKRGADSRGRANYKGASGGTTFVDRKNKTNVNREGGGGGVGGRGRGGGGAGAGAGAGGGVGKKLIDYEESEDGEEAVFNMAMPF